MSSKQTFLAKALYDNIAESPDELAFRRGDILTVVEQNTEGLDGWWLCALRGKSGIAPGNRLKLLTGMYTSDSTSDISLPTSTPPRPSNMSQVDWHRRSWDFQPNKVVTPRKVGDIYIYNQPNKSVNDYDVPPSRYFPNESINGGDSVDAQGNYTHSPSSRIKVDNSSLMYDTPPPRCPGGRGLETDNIYSVPLPRTDTYDTPRSNRSSMISTMSAESTMTYSSTSTPSLPRSSNPPSMCDSARSSLDVSPHDLYDVPSSLPRAVKQTSTDSGLDACMYDSPARPKGIPENSHKYNIYAEPSDPTYDTIKNRSKEHSVDDIYDVPTNNAPRIVLETSSESEHDEGTLKFNGRKVSSGVYAIPPQVTRDSVLSMKSDSSDENPRLSSCSVSSRDSDVPCFDYDELPLDLDSAMDLLVKLQQDVQKSTTKMNTFVSSTWRKRDKLEPKLYEIKLACNDLKTSMEAFIDFAQGALANSMRVADKNLIKKIYRQLSPLQNALHQIQNCIKNLDENKWALSKLVVESGSSKNDDLGQIASLSKDLNSDVRKLASFIQGNSTLLFKKSQDGKTRKNSTPDLKKGEDKATVKGKPDVAPKPQLPPRGQLQGSNVQQRPLPAPPPRDRPLPPTPPAKSHKKSDIVIKRISTGSKESLLTSNHYENDEKKWVDDYDYVHLEGRDKSSKPSNMEPTKDTLQNNEDDISPKQKAALDKLEEDLKTPVNTDMSKFISPDQPSCGSTLEPNDQQLLSFYTKQLDTHGTLLTNSIDAFFGCIEYNEPPRVFIAHSKYVVLAAHKLVYIGDTLNRNLLSSDIRSKIMHCANYLCDCLKLTVTATKTAALQYPSVQAVQEMVDRVVDVSHAGNELKLVIVQAGKL